MHIRGWTGNATWPTFGYALYTKEQAPRVMHYVEVRTKAKEVEELDLDLRTNNYKRVKPLEEMSTFQLSPKQWQVTQSGNQLAGDNQSHIQQTIQEHIDLFTWSAVNMPKLNLGFHYHKLAIYKDANPIA